MFLLFFVVCTFLCSQVPKSPVQKYCRQQWMANFLEEKAATLQGVDTGCLKRIETGNTEGEDTADFSTFEKGGAVSWQY